MKRTLATLLCTMAWITAPAAQAPAPASPAPAPVAQVVVQTVGLDRNANDIRQQLQELLRSYPPSVQRVIALDPALLSNEAFMAPYSQLAAFLAQHPDVARNPTYYFGNAQENFYSDPRQQAWELWEDIATGGMVFAILASVAAFLGWLLKTFMDHRRWLHVSKVQTEAHNKLLDRLTGHDELLAYIQSPSGRRFLEAAPVLDPGPRAASAPFGRVLWSAQIGVVLVFAGIGLHLAARSISDIVSAPLSLIGTLAVALGVGFVISAAAAYSLSRRFGLVEHNPGA